MNLDLKGLIGTIVFHVTILILFLVMAFRTPLPLPSEQGILINFGDAETGYGTVEPRRTEQIREETASQSVPETTPVEAEEEISTQDYEEAPAVESKKKVEKKKEVKKPVEQTKNNKVEEKEPEEKPREVNTRALYKGKRDDTDYSGGEGEAGGTGNQGDLNGSETATSRSLGFGSGDGISASLYGRNPVSLPTPEFNHQQEGKVVVEITVDRSGKVTSAVPGVKGSTTLDRYLLSVAKKAALASKFDNKSDAPMYQKGTITYYFRLK